MNQRTTAAFFLLFGTALLLSCNTPADKESTQREQSPVADNGPDKEAGALLTLDNLNGRWASAEDEKSEIEFQGTAYKDYYDGEEMGKGTFALNACETSTCNGNTGTCLVIKMDGDEMCFIILEANATGMSMSLIGGRGNTLSYKRK